MSDIDKVVNEMLNEDEVISNSFVVYCIKRQNGYVDRGGRNTYSPTQMWFWKTKEAAQVILDRGMVSLYVGPKEDISKWEIVPGG